MIYILILALVILMGMTLFSLLKGLNAFRQSIDANLDPAGAQPLHRLLEERFHCTPSSTTPRSSASVRTASMNTSARCL